MAAAANAIIVILELVGLSISAKRRGWGIFQFYTQLSNIIALASSVCFLLAGKGAAWLRFTGTSMLIMTFLVTVFVLVPMGAGFKTMMLESSGLFHHTLCPILSTASYLLLEPHARAWYVPVGITFVYGMVMLYLNWKGLADGPYPFFRVRQQRPAATVLWMAVLTGAIALIALGLVQIA